MRYYVDSFTDYKTYVDIGEYRVKLPPIPAKHEIINYGLPEKEQFIRRTSYEVNSKQVYAGDIRRYMWDKLPEKLKDEIDTKEWHRRKNGVWYYVNGRTIYVPGNQYFFINYYTFEDGTKPQWWDSQWFDFLFIQDSFFSWDVLANFKVKGRRGGGTAVANSCNLDYCTRFHGSRGGNINKTEDDAIEVNFKPIVNALLNLPYYFLPMPYKETIGTEKRRMKIANTLEFKTVDGDCINSIIDYKATTEKGYDGGKMRWLTKDEYAKLKHLDITSSIRTHVLCVKDGGIKHNVKNRDTGKIIKPAALLYLLSSIDEISDEQLGRVNIIWKTCDPATKTETLCSTHGIRRYFEKFSFGFKGYIDDFGFSLVDKCDVVHDAIYENIKKIQGKSAAREFRRQHPKTIDDALAPSVSQCVFNIDILTQAKKILEAKDIDDPMRPVRGRLDWIEKFKSVMWTPVPDADDNDVSAKFIFSGHPVKKNNIFSYLGDLKPGHAGKYVISIDPIDYNKNDTSEKTTRLSKPSMRAKFLYDQALDGEKFDKEGNPIDYGLNFESNRTIATYLYRPELASEFFEDACKLAIYLGSPVLMEKSKTLRDYFVDNGMGLFLYNASCETIDDKSFNNAWVNSTPESVRQYFDATSSYIGRWGLAERHIECVDVLMDLTPANMTKKDLGAAYVIGEYADMTLAFKYKEPVDNLVGTGLTFGALN